MTRAYRVYALSLLRAPITLVSYASRPTMASHKAEFMFGKWAPGGGGGTSASGGGAYASAAPEPQSDACGGTAHLLPRERARASFDVAHLTRALDGDDATTARRRWLWSEGEPYDNSGNIFNDRLATVRQHVDRFIGIHEKFAGSFKPKPADLMFMNAMSRNSGAFGLHFGAFCPTITSQGTDAQRAEWLKPAQKMEIVGCLAQTELGHGSNVRGLQTTATFDPTTQEFVLHTPTLRSMKFWPGGLGKTATHACVYAQLNTNGKWYGVHTFVLQLRDEHHRTLPGIEIGEVGPKFGDNYTETGYMRLNHVRVPRDWMLMRHQSVSEDGTYVRGGAAKAAKAKAASGASGTARASGGGAAAASGAGAAQPKAGGGKSKIQYLTMLKIRSQLVMVSGYKLAQGCTVVARYGMVRQQGFATSADSAAGAAHEAAERSVMDYQVMQFRVLRELSRAYGYVFVGKDINTMLQALKAGERSGTSDFSFLPDMHASSSGLKALCTEMTSVGLEDMRKACGGHGVLLASGIAQMSLDYACVCTAEGDCTILYLQCARHLVKVAGKVRRGEGSAPGGACDYLVDVGGGPAGASTPLSCEVATKTVTVADFVDLNTLVSLFRCRALAAVRDVCDQLDAEAADAWNRCMLDLVRAARAHCELVIMRAYQREVSRIADADTRRAMSRLAALYALTQISADAGAFDLGRAQAREAAAALRSMLKQLRPDVAALTDAFEFSDNTLNSAIGRHDGNVYEAIYTAAKSSPLNAVPGDVFGGKHRIRTLDTDFIARHARMVRTGATAAARSRL